MKIEMLLNIMEACTGVEDYDRLLEHKTRTANLLYPYKIEAVKREATIYHDEIAVDDHWQVPVLGGGTTAMRLPKHVQIIHLC